MEVGYFKVFLDLLYYVFKPKRSSKVYKTSSALNRLYIGVGKK